MNGEGTRQSGGGCYFRFTAGRPDASAVHMRYISRPLAVQGGCEGVRLVHFPPEIAHARSFSQLRGDLLAYAAARELIERRAGKGRRTHYRALMSFETDITCEKAMAMAQAWLQKTLPEARAAIFFHTDTAHRHLHLWIEARQRDGRKIVLDARAFRRLDEVWNRLYAREMGRSERLHLNKKRETAAYRAARRRQLPAHRPPRAARRLSRREYREREATGAGAYDIELRRSDTDKREAAARAAYGQSGERGAASTKRRSVTDVRGSHAGERTIEAFTRACDRAVRADADAVSQLQQLYTEAARLVERRRSLTRHRAQSVVRDRERNVSAHLERE